MEVEAFIAIIKDDLGHLCYQFFTSLFLQLNEGKLQFIVRDLEYNHPLKRITVFDHEYVKSIHQSYFWQLYPRLLDFGLLANKHHNIFFYILTQYTYMYNQRHPWKRLLISFMAQNFAFSLK